MLRNLPWQVKTLRATLCGFLCKVRIILGQEDAWLVINVSDQGSG
nr:hypothetical protein [Erwinia tracheiphila]